MNGLLNQLKNSKLKKIKQDLTIYCLNKIHFKYQNTDRIQVKVCKMCTKTYVHIKTCAPMVVILFNFAKNWKHTCPSVVE